MSMSMVRFCGRADGFDEAADAEGVAGLAQDAVGGADDEVDRGRREGVVAEAGMVEFAENKIPAWRRVRAVW